MSGMPRASPGRSWLWELAREPLGGSVRDPFLRLMKSRGYGNKGPGLQSVEAVTGRLLKFLSGSTGRGTSIRLL